MEKKYKQFQVTVDQLFHKGNETVGAVVMDTLGNIASGTSTGGITAKKAGRVGDSPIIGCGCYADNLLGGCSATGHGESIMKVTLSRLALQFIEKGFNATQAARKALEQMESRVHGHGGLIIISNLGEIGYSFTTERMAWAAYKNNILTSGIYS